MSLQPKNTYFECPRVIHEGTACVSCKRKSIAGIRYRCGHCPNLDLCEPCYRSVKHDETHLFVIIKDPICYLPSQPLITIIPKLVKPNNIIATTTTSPLQQKNPLASSFNPDQFSMQLTKEEQSNNRRFAPLNDSFHSFNESNNNNNATKKTTSSTSIFAQLTQVAEQQQQNNQPFGSFFESNKVQNSNTSGSGGSGFSGFGSMSSYNNNNNSFNIQTPFDRQETSHNNQYSPFGSNQSSPFTFQSNTFAFGTSPAFTNQSSFSSINIEDEMGAA
jgi:hypothetical protein